MVIAHAATIADRIADCLARYERGCRSIDRTRWLITTSRAILDRGRPVISGGGPDPLSETVIRTRVRALIDTGVLTPARLGCLWEWTCRQRHPCSGCGLAITPGDIEVEISTHGVVLFLHRRCLELWAQEADANPGASAHPETERRRKLA
jgi:hypothetical protein